MCVEKLSDDDRGRSFQRDYEERDVEESENASLSRSFVRFSSSPSHARARDRAGRGVESRRGDTFSVSLSLHLAARVHDYDAPVP